jgi:hypothetical protein
MLQELPDAIENMPLVSLNLASCENLISLPNTIGNISTLSFLNLQGD